MKYLLLLVAIVFLSCSRDNILNSGEPEISFDLNGKHYEHKGQPSISNGERGAGAIKNPGNLARTAYYQINGFTNSSNNIFLFVKTDSLKQISYRLTSGITGVMADGNQHIFYDASDFLDLSITGYSNATINGTFSGKISQVTGLNPYTVKPAIVTNGQIKNVKVIYR